MERIVAGVHLGICRSFPSQSFCSIGGTHSPRGRYGWVSHRTQRATMNWCVANSRPFCAWAWSRLGLYIPLRQGCRLKTVRNVPSLFFSCTNYLIHARYHVPSTVCGGRSSEKMNRGKRCQQASRKERRARHVSMNATHMTQAKTAALAPIRVGGESLLCMVVGDDKLPSSSQSTIHMCASTNEIYFTAVRSQSQAATQTLYYAVTEKPRMFHGPNNAN